MALRRRGLGNAGAIGHKDRGIRPREGQSLAVAQTSLTVGLPPYYHLSLYGLASWAVHRPGSFVPVVIWPFNIWHLV